MADAIFIVGYYRSGTSALSGILQRLGVTLHNDADRNEHNPLGYYEIPELIEIDVEIFDHLGVEWTDLRGLPEGWLDRADLAPFISRLDEILRRRFAGERLIGIKHPHLCRLLPLYERVTRQAGHRPHAVLICRDPWSVAASQQRKNGLSRAHALLLWIGYLLDAERQSRHLRRSWLTYHDLLDSPAGQVQRIERDLGLELRQPAADAAAGALEFVAAGLNRSAPLDSAGLYRPLQKLAHDLWAAVLARDAAAATWDRFAADHADIVSLLTELGASKAVAVPGLGARPPDVTEPAALRPAERLDEGARQRLLARAGTGPALPRLGVLIAAPPNRAHAVNDTLESLRDQWRRPDWIRIVAADACDIPGHATITAPAAAGGVTAMICAEFNAAADADYVALLNAGDTVDPDACLRFAMEAARTDAAMLYCDEVVDAGGAPWIRFKPAWDVTRLRQAAYLGDWIWYHADTVKRLGGFNPSLAGAEEYDVQLRLAEAGGKVVRLPEALFRRARTSRRDNIPSAVFGAHAAAAVTAHCARAGLAGEVRPRQHLGLFQQVRTLPDPGTSIILLCDGAEIPALDRWLKELLTGPALSGPIILAGHDLSPQTATYLTEVAARTEALEGKVLAVPPAGLAPGEALARALSLTATPHVAVVEARSQPVSPGWLAALRDRLADPGVLLAGGRVLSPLNEEGGRFTVHGPLVNGAENRLGAGHLAEDPGPGGWLAVDQEVSAVGPPFVARHVPLRRCHLLGFAGDALWAGLAAQLRAGGGRIVWTPDVSFVASAVSAPATAGIASAEDRYHHPALRLQGDLLAPESRFGLVRSTPPDPDSVLLSGPAEDAMQVLNATRALRAAGRIEAGWAPEPLRPAEITRHAAARWIRLNPETVVPGAPRFTAMYTKWPSPGAGAAIALASQIIATSPALVAAVAGLAPPGRPVTLWRPALSEPVWHNFAVASGLNSKPRILWIDEGFAPPWFAALINESQASAAWIVVERPGTTYSGTIARLKPPPDEQGWAREMAALAPHLLLRPVEQDNGADHYPALLAAAGGCHILADVRLDLPASLPAVRLPNDPRAWCEALRRSLDFFAETLANGVRTRAACLALPSIEAAAPPWAGMSDLEPDRCAAE